MSHIKIKNNSISSNNVEVLYVDNEGKETPLDGCFKTIELKFKAGEFTTCQLVMDAFVKVEANALVEKISKDLYLKENKNGYTMGYHYRYKESNQEI